MIVKVNIYRTQAFDSTMSGYFCVVCISFILNNKRLADFTKVYYLNNFLKLKE